MVQNVILPYALLISLDENVSKNFLCIIYIGNIKTFWHGKLYMKTCYSSKSLWVLLVLYLSPKCSNTPRPKYMQGGQNVLILPICILLSKVFRRM